MDSSFLYSKEFFSVWNCFEIFWLYDDREHTSKFPFVETELMWFAYDSGFICNELVRIVREFKNKSYFSYFEIKIQFLVSFLSTTDEMLTQYLNVVQLQLWIFPDFISSCKEFQNLHSFFAIVMGLSNIAVSRLSQTWEVNTFETSHFLLILYLA